MSLFAVLLLCMVASLPLLVLTLRRTHWGSKIWAASAFGLPIFFLAICLSVQPSGRVADDRESDVEYRQLGGVRVVAHAVSITKPEISLGGGERDDIYVSGAPPALLRFPATGTVVASPGFREGRAYLVTSPEGSGAILGATTWKLSRGDRFCFGDAEDCAIESATWRWDEGFSVASSRDEKDEKFVPACSPMERISRFKIRAWFGRVPTAQRQIFPLATYGRPQCAGDSIHIAEAGGDWPLVFLHFSDRGVPLLTVLDGGSSGRKLVMLKGGSKLQPMPLGRRVDVMRIDIAPLVRVAVATQGESPELGRSEFSNVRTFDIERDDGSYFVQPKTPAFSIVDSADSCRAGGEIRIVGARGEPGETARVPFLRDLSVVGLGGTASIQYSRAGADSGGMWGVFGGCGGLTRAVFSVSGESGSIENVRPGQILAVGSAESGRIYLAVSEIGVPVAILLLLVAASLVRVLVAWPSLTTLPLVTMVLLLVVDVLLALRLVVMLQEYAQAPEMLVGLRMNLRTTLAAAVFLPILFGWIASSSGQRSMRYVLNGAVRQTRPTWLLALVSVVLVVLNIALYIIERSRHNTLEPRDFYAIAISLFAAALTAWCVRPLYACFKESSVKSKPWLAALAAMIISALLIVVNLASVGNLRDLTIYCVTCASIPVLNWVGKTWQRWGPYALMLLVNGLHSAAVMLGFKEQIGGLHFTTVLTPIQAGIVGWLFYQYAEALRDTYPVAGRGPVIKPLIAMMGLLVACAWPTINFIMARDNGALVYFFGPAILMASAALLLPQPLVAAKPSRWVMRQRCLAWLLPPMVAFATFGFLAFVATGEATALFRAEFIQYWYGVALVALLALALFKSRRPILDALMASPAIAVACFFSLGLLGGGAPSSTEAQGCGEGGIAQIARCLEATNLSTNELRMAGVLYPERIGYQFSSEAAGVNATFDEMRWIAGSDWAGNAGRGFMTLPPRTKNLNMYDNASVIHLVGPFGRYAAYSLCAAFGYLLSLAIWSLWRERECLTLGPFVAATAISVLSVTSAYIVMANLQWIPFTGRNLYLIIAQSFGDLVEASLLIGIAIVGMWKLGERSNA